MMFFSVSCNLNVDGYLSSCFCKSYIYHQQVVCCVGKLSYKILYELFMSFFHLWTETFICFFFIIFLTFFLKHLKCVVPQNLMVKILIIFLWKLMLSENFIRFLGKILIVYSRNVLTKALNKPFKNNELEKNVS